MNRDVKDAQINNFAIRSFRNTADRDYIHARLAYKARLIPQFQWSALHCLEKYSKCIMLLNRIDGKSVRHEVTPAIEKINLQNRVHIELSEQTDDFIKHLESGARFRYLEVSWSNRKLDIARLDRAVWEIRRYCQPLWGISEDDGSRKKYYKLRIESLRGIQKITNANSRIMGGVLERILKDKNNPSREGLIYKNLFYSTSSRKKVVIRDSFSAENAPLWLEPELLNEITKYIYFPKSLQAPYLELISKRKNPQS